MQKKVPSISFIKLFYSPSLPPSTARISPPKFHPSIPHCFALQIQRENELATIHPSITSKQRDERLITQTRNQALIAKEIGRGDEMSFFEPRQAW
jgi:hypothetical protein